MNNDTPADAIEAATETLRHHGVVMHPDDIAGLVQDVAAALRTTSLAAQDGLVDAAGELALAEAEYRRKHDLCGRGHIDTGRAWDRMRRAGDKVRAALASIEVKS